MVYHSSFPTLYSTCLAVLLVSLLLVKDATSFALTSAPEHIANLNSHRSNTHTRRRRSLRLFANAEPEPNSNNSNNSNNLTIKDNITTSKSPPERRFLQDSLNRKSLFQNVSPQALRSLTESFEKIEVAPETTICEQGDAYDYVYLVGQESQCVVLVDGVQVPEPYGTIAAGELFGELGVLYQQKRSATIRAADNDNSDNDNKSVTLYRVQGKVFLKIVNKSDEKLADMYTIDEAINQVSGTQALYGGDIIPPYKPERVWLWKQYRGTILRISLVTTVLNMLVAVAFIVYAKHITGVADASWNIAMPDMDMTQHMIILPDKNNPFIQRVSLIHEIWGYQKTLTTFVLTFFLSQSFSFWNQVYDLARSIQGRLNDIHLLLATNVIRETETEDGSLSPAAHQLLDDIGQYSRLYHVLMWASVAKRFAVLTSPAGLDRMESRGLMTQHQLQVLQSLQVPDDQLYVAPLEWMMIRINQGMATKLIANDTATKGQFLKQITALRAGFATIDDKMAGRMPLAYTHLVQILVDSLVLTAPVALYADLGDYSVFAVGIITLSYTGFLNLSKIFLDPLNNEQFCDNSIFMDLGVLIREANAGSTRYKNAGAKLPL